MHPVRGGAGGTDAEVASLEVMAGIPGLPWDSRRLLILRADEVDWISSAANYVELHSQGRVFMLRTTMNEIEEA